MVGQESKASCEEGFWAGREVDADFGIEFEEVGV